MYIYIYVCRDSGYTDRARRRRPTSGGGWGAAGWAANALVPAAFRLSSLSCVSTFCLPCVSALGVVETTPGGRRHLRQTYKAGRRAQRARGHATVLSVSASRTLRPAPSCLNAPASHRPERRRFTARCPRSHISSPAARLPSRHLPRGAHLKHTHASPL